MGAFEVSAESLRTVSGEWSDQHDSLARARRQLFAASDDTALAGPRVRPALDTFLDHWVGELRRHARAAERHSETLATAARNYDASDQAAREAFLSLLPWDAR